MPDTDYSTTKINEGAFTEGERVEHSGVKFKTLVPFTTLILNSSLV